ncbi:MAG: sulfotransferase domain-containing protein [Candidatus Electryonea clarkiae]|nr:sulfotransferase domain-containing protein [Candidatus Electryonea clarkiae]MDP8287051.1 sulfotransferase domain-containing protein [Candidatus Electryonea clarkiae]
MKEPLIIVSGLPRSGTSVMMQILEAGGISSVTDNLRSADIDNPKGYYEFEKVKQIKEDSSWLKETEGKVFKMVSMLLFYLPSDYNYKIIFMRRNLEEILRSEHKMLDRLGKERGASDEEMSMLFNKHLGHIQSWLKQQDNIEVEYVWYNELMKNPQPILNELPAFTGKKLDIDAMMKVIDPSLYRNKAVGENL